MTRRQQERIKREIQAGRATQSSADGCLHLEGQYDVASALRSTGKNGKPVKEGGKKGEKQKEGEKPMPTSGMADTLRRSLELYDERSMKVEFIDAMGDAVQLRQGEEGDWFAWTVRSDGRIMHPDLNTREVTGRDATVIGERNRFARHLELKITSALNSEVVIPASAHSNGTRDIAQTLHSYGMDDRLAKSVASKFASSGSDRCTNMVDLFTMGANVAFALTEGLACRELGDVHLQRRDGWFGNQVRDVVMSALEPGQDADRDLLTQFAREGGKCLYVNSLTDLYLLAAIDVCRGQGRTSVCPARMADARWRLRGADVTYQNRALWVVYGPRWSRREEVEESMDEARRIIAHDPGKILFGMSALARRYGTWSQLDHALGRAIALTFGPLLPVGDEGDAVQSIASTCFLEIGSVATPTTALPPITCRPDFLNSYLAEEQLRRTNPSEYKDDDATKAKAGKMDGDLQYFQVSWS